MEVSGKALMQLVEQWSKDLEVLDEQIRHADGLELAVLLKVRRGLARVRLILLTSLNGFGPYALEEKICDLDPDDRVLAMREINRMGEKIKMDKDRED